MKESPSSRLVSSQLIILGKLDHRFTEVTEGESHGKWKGKNKFGKKFDADISLFDEFIFSGNSGVCRVG